LAIFERDGQAAVNAARLRSLIPRAPAVVGGLISETELPAQYTQVKNRG